MIIPSIPIRGFWVELIPSPDLDAPWGRRPAALGRFRQTSPGSRRRLSLRRPLSARHAMLSSHLPPLYAPNPSQAVRCVLHEDAPRFAEAGLSDLLHLNAPPSREIPQ